MRRAGRPHHGLPALLVGVLAGALTAGCASDGGDQVGTGSGGGAAAASPAAPASPSPSGTPHRAVVSGVPVEVVLPDGVETTDPVDTTGAARDWLHLTNETGSSVLTVLAYDTAFTPPAVTTDGPRIGPQGRVTPPPAAIVEWLQQDPALELSEPVPTTLGDVPATQVDVTSVGKGSQACASGGHCTFVVGSDEEDVSVLWKKTDRFAFLTAPDGTPLALRITANHAHPEEYAELWQPVLDSLRFE